MSDPLTPEEHFQLGVSYDQSGKLDLAMREYERAATGPTAATALTCQGNIHLTREDLPAVEAKYRAALAVDPDQVHALNNLAGCSRRRADRSTRLSN
jgi:Flp pilus assembly protein TadD